MQRKILNCAEIFETSIDVTLHIFPFNVNHASFKKVRFPDEEIQMLEMNLLLPSPDERDVVDLHAHFVVIRSQNFDTTF
jgi:hypothetical protein